MPLTSEGLCSVCGVKTTQRCPSCAQNGVGLYFCGRMHQKLAWFAHKRVCGDNAKPFRLPLLSPDEAADLLANLNKPAIAGERSGPTLAEALTEYFRNTGIQDWTGAIESLTSTAPAPFPNEEVAQVLLLALRVRRCEQHASSASPDLTANTFADKTQHAGLLRSNEPFAVTSRLIMDLYAAMESVGIRRPAFEQKEWCQDLYHQTLIGVALDYKRVEKLIAFFKATNSNVYHEPPEVTELNRLRRGTRQFYVDLLLRIRAENPEAVEEMAQQFAVLPVFREERVAIGGWVSTGDGIDLRRV